MAIQRLLFAMLASAILLGAAAPSRAQVPPGIDEGGKAKEAVEWLRTYGQSPEGDLVVPGLVRAHDGGYFAGGTVSDPDGYAFHAWVAKLDPAGHFEWQHYCGPAGQAYIMDMALALDGGCVAAGASVDPVTGQEDALIFKVDPSGGLVWLKTLTGPSVDEIHTIQTTPDGGFIVAGLTYSEITDRPNAWVTKLDQNGECVWRRTFSPDVWNTCGEVVPLAGGGYLGVGRIAPGSSTEGWYFKLDEDGEVLWQRSFGESRVFPSRAVPVPGGSCAMAGSTLSAQFYNSEVWLGLVGSDGTLIWQNAYGGTDEEDIWYFAGAADGGLLASCYTQSLAPYPAAWVFKTNGAGQITWQKVVGDQWSGPGPALLNPDGTATVMAASWFSTLLIGTPFMTRFDPYAAPSAACPNVTGAALAQWATSYQPVPASIPSTLEGSQFIDGPLVSTASHVQEETLCGESYSLFFTDDLGRSRFCVNPVTGAYKFTVLTGGAPISHQGICSAHKNGSSWFFYAKPGGSNYLSASYDEARQRAWGRFTSRSPLIIVQLQDANTADDPQACE
jgi:hypothetical protein